MLDVRQIFFYTQTEKELKKMKNLRKVGFWSAILSAIFSIIWFITFQLQDVIAPVPEWTNLAEYAKAFSPLRILLVYPSLLLPLSYITMICCIHYSIQKEKRFLSLISIAIGILYASLASTNYNIQAVSMRKSLASGFTSGSELFIPDNPSSIFTALSNSYAYMAISMFFSSFVFDREKKHRWVRWIFLAQIFTAIGQIGWTMFDLNTNIFIFTSMIWVIGAPIAFILIAILFLKGQIEDV
jgi:hypothetical protein